MTDRAITVLGTIFHPGKSLLTAAPHCIIAQHTSRVASFQLHNMPFDWKIFECVAPKYQLRHAGEIGKAVR